MSEYALRRHQAKTTFINAFAGLELDGRIPCNDCATRIMAGSEHDTVHDNCWLRCMKRMFEYSGRQIADIAVSKDDMGISCAQYAAAADAAMQLGLLRELLQNALDDAGHMVWSMLLLHKQSLQLAARCLGHLAALQFISDILHRGDENKLVDIAGVEPGRPLQHAAPMAAKQLMLLTTARSLRAPKGVKLPAEREGLHAQPSLDPPLTAPAPAPHPRHDMMKFR